MLKIAKSYERTEMEQAHHNLALKKLLHQKNPSDYDDTSLFNSPEVGGQDWKYEEEKNGSNQSNYGSKTPFGVRSPVKVNHDIGNNFYQSQINFSENDDNVSAVILNYEGLNGLINT